MAAGEVTESSATTQSQVITDTPAEVEGTVVETQPASGDQIEQNENKKKIEVAAVAESVPIETPATEEAQQTPQHEAGRLVKLRFNAGSWVDLRDANGQRLLYENVTEGREISVQGNPPFSVFLGNAEGVQIDYAGKPFDFSAFTNGVYARFELGLEHANQP